MTEPGYTVCYGHSHGGGNSGKSGKSGNTVRIVEKRWVGKGVLAWFGDSDGRYAKNGTHAYTHRKHTIPYSGVPQILTAGSTLIAYIR